MHKNGDDQGKHFFFFKLVKINKSFFYQDMAANLTDVYNEIVEFQGA